MKASTDTGVRVHRIIGVAACCYLIEMPAALFLIDGGMVGTGPAILRHIARLGRTPGDVRLAVVTHAHADHFGGLGAVQHASGCRIVCHPAHVELLRAGHAIASPGRTLWGRTYGAFARLVLPRIELPRLERVESVEEGARLDAYGLPGRVLHTPGHSTGDLTLLLDDGSAFVGDLVQGRRVPGVSQPQLSAMAIDEGQMLASWSRLIESGAQTVYPAHGTPVRIADVRAAYERLAERRR